MKTALILVDHGSRREEAHAQLERLAQRVRERRPGLEVHVAHLELAAPSVAQALAMAIEAGAREIVIHPLFLVPGRHLGDDLPARVREALADRPGVTVRVTAPLGTHPGLADLILSALDAAARDR